MSNFKDIGTSIKKIEDLLEIISRLREAGDLQGKLELIAKGIQLCGWQRVHLYLYDPDKEAVKSAAYAGLTDKEINALKTRRITLEKIKVFFTGQLDHFRIGRCFYIPHDATGEVVERVTDGGVEGHVDASDAGGWHHKDFLYIPLISQITKKPLGLLSVDDPLDGKRPTKDSLKVVELFIDYVTTIIEEDEFRKYLDKTQDLLDRLFYISPTFNIITDEDGNIISVNKAAINKFGYSKDKFLERHESDIFSDPEFYGEFKDTRERDGEFFGECRFVNKDGEQVYGHLNSVAVYSDVDQLEGFILIIGDLTDTKALQQQLIRAEKMASIGILASGVAHELNNPLYGVLGLLETALDEDNIKTIKGYIKEMLEYVEEAAEIVQDLHEYSYSAKADVSSTVNMNDLLAAVLKMLKGLGEFKGIEIITDYSDVPDISASTTDLEQLFVNLLTNASEAIENEGRIEIRTGQIDDRIQIVVKDSGVGIADDDIDKIFEPFYTTKDVGEGTGLGLYSAYKIITKYDGTVAVESKENKGTEITIIFPLQVREAE